MEWVDGPDCTAQLEELALLERLIRGLWAGRAPEAVLAEIDETVEQRHEDPGGEASGHQVHPGATGRSLNEGGDSEAAERDDEQQQRDDVHGTSRSVDLQIDRAPP